MTEPLDIQRRFERLERAVQEIAEAIVRREWGKDLYDMDKLGALRLAEWDEFQRLIDEERG